LVIEFPLGSATEPVPTTSEPTRSFKRKEMRHTHDLVTSQLRRKVAEAARNWLEVTFKMAVEKHEDFFERPSAEIVSAEIYDKLKTSIDEILRKPD
jgi:hypothetical protein